MKIDRAVLLAALTACASPAFANEATIVWWDPSCRYFVAQLPDGTDGFGLYEWKEGAEVKEGSVIEGDILGGPDVKGTEKSSGQPVNLVHWGDAKKLDVLVRHSPDWCKAKRKRK